MGGIWSNAALKRRREDTDEQDLLKRRRLVTCPAQSVSYENTEPLWMVRGEGQYLFDVRGRRFLDTRNNVPHCGHCCPAVAEAVAEQVKQLNTNTRYLHQTMITLAESVLATMPPKLTKIFFLNSGSEANDLAVRLAEAYTRKKGCIIVDRAYHGHTVSTIALSPYKYEHKNAHGQLPHIRKVRCPDTFRGVHKGYDAAELYAKDVKDAIEDLGGDVSAFFIESGMSVAGVVLPPAGYLSRCYEYVRAKGGVCVADEVQTGFGRFGSTFWGFQQQGVEPDIVTMGKPFGNGMPLAAVVCTEEISEAFAKGPEYFNTFGGNPVCAAAGLAVMQTIEKQRLQQNAAATGVHLRKSLLSLQKRLSEDAVCHIGDVRGCGLFLGIDFVKQKGGTDAAKKEAGLVCSRLKDRHQILTSLDGPLDNVMVVKPPLVFSAADADVFVAALEEVLRSLTPADVETATHTPT